MPHLLRSGTVVAYHEIDVERPCPPQELRVEHLALDGDVPPLDGEIETHGFDALETRETLELLLVP
jgi:hypothetical protein